jgi:hypothetical protein
MAQLTRRVRGAIVDDPLMGCVMAFHIEKPENYPPAHKVAGATDQTRTGRDRRAERTEDLGCPRANSGRSRGRDRPETSRSGQARHRDAQIQAPSCWLRSRRCRARSMRLRERLPTSHFGMACSTTLEFDRSRARAVGDRSGICLPEEGRGLARRASSRRSEPGRGLRSGVRRLRIADLRRHVQPYR